VVERAVQYLTKKLANPQRHPRFIEGHHTLRALLDEFRGDIDALKLRVSDIDTRLKTVETAQKNDEAVANRAKIGATYYVRAGTSANRQPRSRARFPAAALRAAPRPV